MLRRPRRPTPSVRLSLLSCQRCDLSRSCYFCLALASGWRGGRRYTEPGWFAGFQQHLYYNRSPVPVLPTYRMVDFDDQGMADSVA